MRKTFGGQRFLFYVRGNTIEIIQRVGVLSTARHLTQAREVHAALLGAKVVWDKRMKGLLRFDGAIVFTLVGLELVGRVERPSERESRLFLDGSLEE